MRMSALQYRFYNKQLLKFVARTLGKVIKVGYNTTIGRGGKFARFAIVVDLNKPLIAFVGINGTPYCAEYEGLSSICYQCGRYDHNRENCSTIIKDSILVNHVVNSSKNLPSRAENIVAGQNCYGPWMKVSS
ncbi:hypothetical protein PVK06_036566 [Gossypium arboreum]|uniref:CCHC-type domain-containing protein n=1 Tax=Gossypium arboreum TaxID=29729 RepID=A0ABR0NJW1_GOSAR|nr:hypothetical protein PVK06_036566 [Gossypium arboreum]